MAYLPSGRDDTGTTGVLATHMHITLRVNGTPSAHRRQPGFAPEPSPPAEQVERWVPSASVLHSNSDAMDIGVREGRIVGVRGRCGDRVNRGRLGPKDLFGWQANASPDRLTPPLVRDNGELVESDWDTALDRVVRCTQGLMGSHGPSAVGFYTTGQLFLAEYYTLSLVARGGLGTNHLNGTRDCVPPPRRRP
jgi:anaerobic selenocysteine-containing dehydrogenase